MNDILDILTSDARTSMEDIAKMTGKKIEEVKKTIKRYEKEGVILKYKPERRILPP